MTLNRGRSVEIRERYLLEALRRPFTLNLMTPLEPGSVEDYLSPFHRASTDSHIRLRN